MKVKVIVTVIVQSAPTYPIIFVLNVFLFNRDVSSYLAVFIKMGHPVYTYETPETGHVYFTWTGEMRAPEIFISQ